MAISIVVALIHLILISFDIQNIDLKILIVVKDYTKQKIDFQS